VAPFPVLMASGPTSAEQECWDAYLSAERAFLTARTALLSKCIDLRGVLRRALRTARERDAALRVVLLLELEDTIGVFPELVQQAGGGTPMARVAAELIARLPRDWVTSRIDAEVREILQFGERREYEVYANLLRELGADVAIRALVRLALSSPRREVRSFGQRTARSMGLEVGPESDQRIASGTAEPLRRVRIDEPIARDLALWQELVSAEEHLYWTRTQLHHNVPDHRGLVRDALVSGSAYVQRAAVRLLLLGNMDIQEFAVELLSIALNETPGTILASSIEAIPVWRGADLSVMERNAADALLRIPGRRLLDALAQSTVRDIDSLASVQILNLAALMSRVSPNASLRIAETALASGAEYARTVGESALEIKSDSSLEES
jgi:hypothetical protein